MFDIVPAAVYGLCFLTSALCAALLVRSYRRTGARLLLWSSICFGLLAGNNLLVIVDILVIEWIDFRVYRLLFSLAAVAVLLFGLIWDLEEDRG